LHTRYFFVVTTSIVLLCHSFSIILAAQPLYPVEKGRGGRNGRSLKKAGGVVGENCDHFHPNNTSEQSTPNRHHCLPIKSNKKSKQHEETKTKKSKSVKNAKYFPTYLPTKTPTEEPTEAPKVNTTPPSGPPTEAPTAPSTPLPSDAPTSPQQNLNLSQASGYQIAVGDEAYNTHHPTPAGGIPDAAAMTGSSSPNVSNSGSQTVIDDSAYYTHHPTPAGGPPDVTAMTSSLSVSNSIPSDSGSTVLSDTSSGGGVGGAKFQCLTSTEGDGGDEEFLKNTPVTFNYTMITTTASALHSTKDLLEQSISNMVANDFCHLGKHKIKVVDSLPPDEVVHSDCFDESTSSVNCTHFSYFVHGVLTIYAIRPGRRQEERISLEESVRTSIRMHMNTGSYVNKRSNPGLVWVDSYEGGLNGTTRSIGRFSTSLSSESVGEEGTLKESHDTTSTTTIGETGTEQSKSTDNRQIFGIIILSLSIFAIVAIFILIYVMICCRRNNDHNSKHSKYDNEDSGDDWTTLEEEDYFSEPSSESDLQRLGSSFDEVDLNAQIRSIDLSEEREKKGRPDSTAAGNNSVQMSYRTQTEDEKSWNSPFVENIKTLHMGGGRMNVKGNEVEVHAKFHDGEEGSTRISKPSHYSNLSAPHQSMDVHRCTSVMCKDFGDNSGTADRSKTKFIKSRQRTHYGVETVDL